MTRLAALLCSLLVALAALADEDVKPAPPAPIKIKLRAPAEGVPLSQAKKIAVHLDVTNVSKEPVVVYGYASWGLKDAAGNAVDRNRNMGRWGRGRPQDMLSWLTFKTVQPGKTVTLTSALASLTDPDAVTGWTLDKPGAYEVTARYVYKRAACVARYGKGCPNPADPAKPWNRCVEVDMTAKARFTIDAPGADEKAVDGLAGEVAEMLMGVRDPAKLDRCVDWAALHAQAKAAGQDGGLTAEQFQARTKESLAQRWQAMQAKAQAIPMLRQIVAEREVAIDGAKATVTVRGGMMVLSLAKRDGDGWKVVAIGKGQRKNGPVRRGPAPPQPPK